MPALSGGGTGSDGGLDAVKRQLESKDAVAGYRPLVLGAIGEGRRDPDDPFVARTHELERFREARDERIRPSGQRFASYVAAVDQRAVEKLYLIVERDGVLRCWMRTAGGAG